MMTDLDIRRDDTGSIQLTLDAEQAERLRYIMQMFCAQCYMDKQQGVYIDQLQGEPWKMATQIKMFLEVPDE